MEHAEYDSDTTDYLEAQGYKIICSWKNDVINDTDGVIREILLTVEGKE
jgi:very-short-patch-repair endonuclease